MNGLVDIYKNLATPSVSRVVADFQKAAERLEAVAAHHSAVANQKRAEAAQASDQASAAVAEAVRASTIKAKLADIFQL